MKLANLKMDEWDGTYKVISENDSLKVVLLHLVNIGEPKEEGRRNLLAVDDNNDIVWFAEPPQIARKFSWFVDAKIQNNQLIAWYSGNVLVEIDLATGKFLKEEFIK